jgi:hypothetical protein
LGFLPQIPQMVAMTPSKEEKMFLWPETFSSLNGVIAEEPPTAAVQA